MKKRIAVSEVRPGMYVVELDRPWLETPFAFPGFEVVSEAQRAQLASYCRYVYIDSAHARAGAPAWHAARGGATAAPVLRMSRVNGHQALDLEILKKYAAPYTPRAYNDTTELLEEVAAADKVHRDAKSLIDASLRDARRGRPVDTRPVRAVAGELTDSVIRNPDALMGFAQAKDKSNYYVEHSLRTCIVALNFGRHLGLAREPLEALGTGALLHDIGMMRIPDEIIERTGELSQEEAGIIEQHVPLGLELLRDAGLPAHALEVVANHHERLDGSGFPRGSARGKFGFIGAIVDLYDSLTSELGTRKASSTYTALRQIYQQRGRLFPAELVEGFIQSIGIYPIGSVVELNTGEVGVVVSMNRVQRLKPKVALALTADNRPHKNGAIVDLTTDHTPGGAVYEIEALVEPDTYGFDATQFLPMACNV